MPSRFTQYGTAVSVDDTLREMVAARLMAEAEQRKIQQQETENAMRAHTLRQGDERIGLEREDLQLRSQPKPASPVALSPGQRLVNPTSGEAIYEAPERPEKPQGPMILSPGAALIDPTQGRIMLKNPTAPPQPTRSLDDELKEFEAKEQIKAKYGGSRPSLGAERQALAYFNRAKQASDDIGGMEDQIAKMGLMGQTGLQVLPNFLQSESNQRYRQAQRAFTEARLRKESGAAIPQGEYENDSRTYFAQPGDSPQVIEQKRRARQTVLEGLKFASGKAHDEFYGQQQEPSKPGVTIKSIRQVR